MKDIRRPGAEKIHNLWKGLTSGIIDKVDRKKKGFSDRKDEAGDMGDTHTPISRLDLTGMNRVQAKEHISKLIDERLEMISRIELAEPEIDYKERERLRAKAEERISKRRTRRRHRIAAAPAETIVTDQGVFSDYNNKHASVFDVIQPESFPFEEDKTAIEAAAPPIEGQLSILDTIPAEKTATVPTAVAAAFKSVAAFSAATEFAPSFDMDPNTREIPKSKWDLLTAKFSNLIKTLKKSDPAESDPDQELYKPHSFDLFGIFPYKSDQEAGREAPAKEGASAAEAMDAETASAETASAETVVAAVAAGISYAAVPATETPAVKTPAAEASAAETPVTETSAEEISTIKAINTSLDEAVDKVFAFYGETREKLLRFIQKISLKTSKIVKGRMLPAAVSGMRRINGRLTPLLQRAESRLQLKNKASIVLTVVSEQEKKVSGKMAQFVDAIDRINEAFLCGAAAVRDKICHCNDFLREFAERHKKQILVEFGVLVAVIAVVTLSIGNATAYEYVYNGKVLGVVKNQEDVYKTIDIIGDKLSVQYDANIVIDKDKDIRFNKIVAFDQDIDSKEDVLNRLTYMRDMKANAKGIYVDGNLMAILESEKTARDILQGVQNEFLKKDPNIQYEKIGFAEDIVIEDIETKLGSIEDKDKVLEYMLTGAMEQKIHVVQPGETFSEIAKIYGKKQGELLATNPDVVPEKLHIGQEIALNQIVPLITVQTTEVAQYIEEIPFDITYENTASLYKNEQTVKSRGVNGEKDVVAEIVRNNGIEVSRNELSATILSEPVSQVVMVGTKEPPPLIGTGTFIYPIRGTLTSRYGTRWGRLHAGIDLAAPIGTHIKASDGGKVTFAGYNGALGYMVEIDHGGGRVTWYGHCSKLLVKKGDKVYQGQHIANVGNTGRSTGPHLHFEVHINGKTKNPLNYL